MSLLLKLLCFTLLIIYMGGCTGHKPITSHYLLSIPTAKELTNINNAHKTILISLPQAAAGFDNHNIIYTRSPQQLESYRDSLWVDTPARMLLPLIVHYLDASGKFGAVLAATTSPIAGEWRLDSEIIRLQQEFQGLNDEQAKVRFTLRVQLLDLSQRDILATQLFEVTVPMAEANAKHGVLASQLAVETLLQQLTEFVISYL